MKPSISSIVHYRSYGTPGGEYLPEPRAAIVTGLCAHSEGESDDKDGTCVDLAVFNPTGMFFNQSVLFSEEPKPGHWSWPPSV